MPPTGVLHLTFHLIGLAFSFELGIACAFPATSFTLPLA
jgi:hypothetical protein